MVSKNAQHYFCKAYFFAIAFFNFFINAQLDTPNELISGDDQSISAEGINTVDELDSGNWYEKLHWWKKAKPKYEEVRKVITEVRAYEKALQERRLLIIAELDRYFSILKIGPKEIQNALSKLIDEAKKKQESSEVVSEDQRNQLIENADKLKELEALKGHFETLVSLRNRIDQAVVDILARQVKTCDSYEEKALDSFEQIENVLDDQKARYLYEIIENAYENIQTILGYIKDSLAPYIENASGKIEQLKPVIKKAIEDLEKRGIIIRLALQESIKQEALKKQVVTQVPQPLSWWHKIVLSISSFFSSIWVSITSFFTNIFGTTTKDSSVTDVKAAQKGTPHGRYGL